MISRTIFLTLIAAIILLVSSCSNEPKTVNIGDKVQHDDFFYSVQKVMKTPDFVGKKSSGTFYVVMFKVQNDAKRVEHPWDRNVVYLVDENGKEYESNIELEKEFSRINYEQFKDKYVTAAGSSDSTVLVFDIPNTVKEPYIKFRGDFLMGDMFDGNQFKNSRVKLF
jgi:hypothetical protein